MAKRVMHASGTKCEDVVKGKLDGILSLKVLTQIRIKPIYPNTTGATLATPLALMLFVCRTL